MSFMRNKTNLADAIDLGKEALKKNINIIINLVIAFNFSTFDIEAVGHICVIYLLLNNTLGLSIQKLEIIYIYR